MNQISDAIRQKLQLTSLSAREQAVISEMIPQLSEAKQIRLGKMLDHNVKIQEKTLAKAEGKRDRLALSFELDLEKGLPKKI